MAGEIKHKWHGTVLTITSDAGTSSADLKGERGMEGIRGPQGRCGMILNPDGTVNYDGYATEDYVDFKIEQLEQEEPDMSNYYTKDEIDATLAEFKPSGGGGGGGGSNNAVMTITNTTGWLSKTIAQGADCFVQGSWSSVEDGMSTGAGSLAIYVSGAVKHTSNVEQGAFRFNVAPYLINGKNTVRVSVSDVYGNTKSIVYTINVVVLTITSTFDGGIAYNGAIVYTYTPMGSMEKTIYFVLDGKQIGTATVFTSGREQNFTIPAQTHGSHKFEVYYETTIDGQIIPSNKLVYDLICIEEGNSTPIISSTFNKTSMVQLETVDIYYSVYNPGAITADISLLVNNVSVNNLTVDRTQQLWTYRAETAGETTLTIKCGNTKKNFVINVEPSDIKVEAETAGLELYLNSYGRSNSEANPGSWIYGDIECQFTNYNWKSDGWQVDDNNQVVHRVAGDARLFIPLNVFSGDARETGKTIEIEFATRDTMDYEAVILSCMNGGIGLEMTAQKATLTSEQSEIFTQYKENEHIRLAFVIEKRKDNRLVYIYLNGIMCGVVQYPDDDNFAQGVPVGISIGSNLATIDLYTIRVYNHNLTRYQILDNWIADTQNFVEKSNRYYRNQIYNDYGTVLINNLPTTLPYLILEAPELPQYKGNKVGVNGRYIDPLNANKCFEFVGAIADVQGTSSAGYARKNYIISFPYDYQLREDSIPTNMFTFKADVASSEGANNVELVRLYNNICPYKTPPQLENANVRQGIDGFPIVIFHNDGKETKFIGKYNFNNDKATPEVFGFEGTDESWEIRNNTSNRVLWKSADFSGTDWLNDFEGRYPKDNTDPTKLARFAEWVVSTDRTGLSEAEAAARLEKFKNEIEQYAVLDSALFYYLFTELFLMVDSRAKNAFPTIYEGEDKVVWLPYDMDTAMGINNEGALAFGYGLEDTDVTETGADVYNGQHSVFWCNLRDAFGDKIKEMYQKLRSDNVLSYEIVEQMFEDHQSVWPEAIWNEDAWYKYLEPLVKDNSAAYLAMLQGSKEEQRKWWLYNRFRYMDAKYNAGDAMDDYITLRGYEKSDITVTPYADIYAAIKYGSYMVQERAFRDNDYTLECPLDTLNDTEIYIYSSSQLKSIGDVSGLKVGYADFSMATRLQDLKLGSNAEGYSNTNLVELYLGNNALLRDIDVRNCPNLTQSIDLRSCANIEHVYFDGTAIKGCSLPDGGILKTLHLPATISNLTIMNQRSLTDLSIPTYENITTLRLENVGDKVDVFTILGQMKANSRVRLINMDWAFNDVSEVYTFYSLLDTMKGLDENGGNVDKVQISGHIHVPSIRSNEIAAFQKRYPYITFTADELYYHIKYQNYDTSLLYEYWTLPGPTAIDPVAEGKIEAPTKPSNGYSNFYYDRWDALPVINGEVIITAQYRAETIYYTVRFLNTDGTVLETVQTTYLTDVVYSGATPKPSASTTYQYFAGWYPQPLNITTNTDCVALYRGPWNDLNEYYLKEITESWSEIIASIRDGSYATKYRPMMYKPLTIGDTVFNMYIVDMYVDTLANDNGKAAITWMAGNADLVLPWHSTSGTPPTLSWETCDLRKYLNGEFREMIPEEVRNAIVPIKKEVYQRSNDSTALDYQVTFTTLTTVNDYLWLRSTRASEYGPIKIARYCTFPGGNGHGENPWTRDINALGSAFYPVYVGLDNENYRWYSDDVTESKPVRFFFCT